MAVFPRADAVYDLARGIGLACRADKAKVMLGKLSGIAAHCFGDQRIQPGIFFEALIVKKRF